MLATSLQLPRQREPRGRGAEPARARLTNPAMRRLVRLIGRRLARIAALLPMSLAKLLGGLLNATTLLPLPTMTTWAERFLGPEAVALGVEATNVVVLDAVVSTEEAGALDSTKRIDRRPTSATMLTTKLATATGTCPTTVEITTSTSPKISTGIQVAEVCEMMCHELATTQLLIEADELPAATTSTSLTSAGASESPCPRIPGPSQTNPLLTLCDGVTLD